MKLDVIGNDEDVSEAGYKHIEDDGTKISISAIDKIKCTGAFKHWVRLEAPDWARSVIRKEKGGNISVGIGGIIAKEHEN